MAEAEIAAGAAGAAIASSVKVRFARGARVRVQRWSPPGHVRTPSFVKGHAGVVQELVGAFQNPEELAYGRRGGPQVPLYRVSFARADLWPQDEPQGDHAVVLDIYETWLQPAEATS